MNLPDEPFGQSSVSGEVHGLDLPHEMPMMMTVAIVVAQHSSVVDSTALQVDIRQAVCNYFSVFKPDLLFEERTFAPAFEPVFLQFRRSNRLLFLAHCLIVSQKGCVRSVLVAEHALTP